MKKWFAAIMVVALIAVGFLAAKVIDRDDTPKVEVSAVSIAEQLSNCSELAAARLDYRGLVQYSEGSIAFLTQKGFTMVYDAYVKAGIDLSQAKVDISGHTIHVTIPAAKILDIHIDSDTLEFYDEKYALFNWENKSDTVTALEYAKEDAEAKVDQTQLLQEASSQTKLLIENLLAPLTDGKEAYTLEIEMAD